MGGLQETRSIVEPIVEAFWQNLVCSISGIAPLPLCPAGAAARAFCPHPCTACLWSSTRWRRHPPSRRADGRTRSTSSLAMLRRYTAAQSGVRSSSQYSTISICNASFGADHRARWRANRQRRLSTRRDHGGDAERVFELQIAVGRPQLPAALLYCRRWQRR